MTAAQGGKGLTRAFFVAPFILQAPDEGENGAKKDEESADRGVPGKCLDPAFDADAVVGVDECGDE